MNLNYRNTNVNLSQYNHSSKLESGYYYLIRILIFIIVIAMLVFFSSLDSAEISYRLGISRSVPAEVKYLVIESICPEEDNGGLHGEFKGNNTDTRTLY